MAGSPYYSLTLQKNRENVSRFTVSSGELVIGRSSKSDLVLPDEFISRQHARLHIENGRLMIEDLGSRNGIIVNGDKGRVFKLDTGDVISLGQYTLQVERGSADESLNDTRQLITFDKAGEIYERMVQQDSAEPLPLLYKASQLLGERCDLGELLNRILNLIAEVFPIRRGFILTRFESAEKPEIRATYAPSKTSASAPLSRTIVDETLASKHAILTTNAQTDPRFADADSIVGQAIHAVMCVPLCGHERVVGVIYVEGMPGETPFSSEDFKLITALGRVTGIAVENTWLNEERLERERLAAVGEAVAGISHSMKNILTSIKASEELIGLAQEKADWKRMRTASTIMHKSLRRFERLVMDLLYFVRGEKLERRPVHPVKLIQEAIEAMAPRAQKHDIQLLFHDEPLAKFDLDSQQIYRVLLNLLENAIEACEGVERGLIEVSCWENDYGLYIQISDNGAGIPPENLPKISKAFFTTKGHRGTGLGLACSYRAVAMHGGRVMVDSEPGKGAAFTIFLPHTPPVSSPGAAAN